MNNCKPLIFITLAIILLSHASLVGHAQEGARFEPVMTLQERVVTPSPQVAEMIRYEDAQLSSCDGTATMSVPLFQWQAGDIPLSLSLNYRIGAFKAAEKPGWIGLGWSLGGTGAVTRSIVGMPDEFRGYESRSPQSIRTDSDGLEYLIKLANKRLDSSLDRYSYSCPGGLGQFVINGGNIVQLPPTDNTITLIGSENDGVMDFRITTPDGTMYDFREREHIEYTYQAFCRGSEPFDFKYTAVTTWHLSRIQSPGGEVHAYEGSSDNTDVRDGYAYDANGNLTADPGRSIESIVYNRINMPRRINFYDGEWIEFVYLADGTKLSMTVPYSFGAKPWPGIDTPADSLGKYPLNARAAGVGKITTNYVGSYETESVRFDRLNLPVGYVTVADSVYHWYLADYQGNICGVVNTASKTLEQYQDYYPYGKPYARGQGEIINRRKFGGKELLTDKGYDAYDFEARPLTITLPRFTQPAPLAETYYPTSIYVYCAGDPINLRDYHGLSADSVNNALPIENTEWPNTGSVIPKDQFKGWHCEPFRTKFIEQNGYEPGCLDYSKEQIAVVGYKTVDANDSGILYPYNENTGVNQSQFIESLTFIFNSIQNSIPFVIGVDYMDGSPGNADKSTDHFVVVVGIGSDDQGNFIQFFENATLNASNGTSDSNRL